MPEMAEEKVDKILNTITNLPGYVFELTANLGSERNFSIRGNFPVGADLPMMNSELDKLVAATNRQLSKACLVSLEEDLAKHEGHLQASQANVATIQKKGERFKGTPQQMQADLDNAIANIEQLQSMIKRKKAILEQTRKDAE